jgi:hypothetical protein
LLAQAFSKIEDEFPVSTRTLLENLQRSGQDKVEHEFRRAGMTRLLPELLANYVNGGFKPGTEGGAGSGAALDAGKFQLNPKQQEVGGWVETRRWLLCFRGSQSEMPAVQTALQPLLLCRLLAVPHPPLPKQASSLYPFPPSPTSPTHMSSPHPQVVSNLLRIKTVVKEHMMVSDEKRTNEFLGAASRGNTQRVRAMLQQQFNPDAADYDGGWASQFAVATCFL